MGTPENTASLLNALGAHLKVVVVEGVWALNRSNQTSPFRTWHCVATGEFHVHESEVTYGTLVHEFGHLVAWHLAGRPEGDNFGCHSGKKVFGRYIADDLERDACCIEVTLRRNGGETFKALSDLMLKHYDYCLDLEWVDGEGYVGGEAYMQEVFARGEKLLARWAEET